MNTRTQNNHILDYLTTLATPATDWRDNAPCSEVDPEIFFPEDGGTPHPAKTVCAACPVKQQCLDFALDNREKWGVWGGLTWNERKKMLPPEPPEYARVDAKVLGMLAEGWSVANIARELKLSQDATNTRIKRARERSNT